LNLVSKVHFFYTHYGLWRTVGRVFERLTGLHVLTLPQPSRSDGLATMILSSSESHSDRSVAPLKPGMAASQDLGVLFDEVFEIDLRLELGADFERGEVLLVGEKRQTVFRESLDAQRAGNGRYSIFFDKPLSVSGAGPLQLFICNRGKVGEIRLGIADQFDCHLAPATQCFVDGHDIGIALSAPPGARHPGPLALRVAGRSSSQHANYHRPQVPQVWYEDTIEVGTLYAAGLQQNPLSRFGRPFRFREATVERLKAEEARPKATGLLLLGRHIDPQRARQLVAAAQRRFMPVVGVLGARRGSGIAELGPTLTEVQLAHWSDVLFVAREKDAQRIKTLCSVDVCRGQPATLPTIICDWIPKYRRRILPRFSIVTILYNKAAALGPVLRSYFQQDYSGDFEVVFVDDASPDDSAALVDRLFAEARDSGRYARLPTYKVVRNPANLGNCVSRNVGVAAAEGDILVVIDADCMLNRHFLSRHAQAHSFGDTDVVVGPLNIETENEDPMQCLERLEAQPHLTARRTQLQDELNRLSFLNCITRNFSIQKEAVERDLFDPAFTYSADPASGFGWEDVEMGYRLYRRGKRIKYVSDAFSVHISHDAASPDRQKPIRSAKNFRRLFDKHPDLHQEARHWARHTLSNLKEWFSALQLEPSEDLKALELMLPQIGDSSPKRARGAGKRAAKLKVLTYRWHVPHQYELYKSGHDFALVRDLGTSMTNSWDLHHRPLPDNARFISKDSIQEREFDLAILHFDENVLSWENTNGVLGEDWGAAFRWFMDNVKLPKVAICHGTPQFYGQYNPAYDSPDLMQVIEPARQKLVEYLGGTLVVCNSHQAQREWGFRNSRVIWHGFDPTELPPASYERGILSPTGPLVLSRPHYRGYFLYKKVFADFPPEFLPSGLSVPDPSPLYHGNQFATWKYRNYVDEIRRYSIYFNPTLRSPMPRARGEPMMCGVVTVSAKNHDVDMFIKNGVNGFYADEPSELKEQLLFLSRNPVAAREIGAAGRRTALDVFNIDRYLEDWRDVIQSLV
jgi:glycosyltransferase involved in cell wall biosynthesis